MAFGLLGQFIGILLILFGGYMVFLFQSYADPASSRGPRQTVGHQPSEFSVSGIFIGLVCLVLGFMLLFY